MASADLLQKLVKSNFLEMLPDDVQEKLRCARLKYFALQDEVQEILGGGSIGPDERWFSDYYNRPGKRNRLEELDPRQKFTVIKVTLELLGVFSSTIKRDCTPEISKNQRRKENRKKGKKCKTAKRGGKKNDDANGTGENEGKSPYLNKEEVRIEIDRVRKIMADERAAADEREAKIHAEMEATGASEESVITSLDIDQEERTKDLLRREKTHALVRCYEDVENALIDLVQTPFFENRESCANEFSNIVSDLVEPGNFSNDTYNKLSSIVDIFSETSKFAIKDDDKFYDPVVRQKRCEEFDIVLPPASDQELFAKTFIQLMKSSIPDNARMIFEMATIIATEYDGNLLKQKVVEVGMYDLLEILKSCVLCHELYMTELIFKVTMAMPCARKYCWRNPEFFPTLAKLLTILDPNPALDKFQIRGDAVHILYTSILAGPREIYELVAKTDAIEHLFTILREIPDNDRDVQTGEDVIMCITLFSEHWDLFHREMRNNHVMKLVQKWRKYALHYASFFPNFLWNIEQLVLRLRVLLQSNAIKKVKPEFRLSSPSMVTQSREFIKTNNQTACSNPACFKLNDPENGSRYKKCSKCHLAYYCSRECQLSHWKTHREWCKRPPWNEKNVADFVTSVSTVRKLANKQPEAATEDVVTQNSLNELE